MATGGSLGDLFVNIIANNSQYDKAIDGSKKKTDTFEGGLTKLSGTVKKLIGAGVLIALANKVADVGKASILAASGAEEARAKFTTAFKGITDRADETATALKTSYGLSQVESEKLLGSTGDLLKGFGATADGALDFSFEIQKLAVDLTSYNDVQGGAARVSNILTKSVLGNKDGLSELGVSLLDTDIKQELVRVGQDKLTGQAGKLAKAQATYRLILLQTEDAQGDYNRSVGSYNQTAIEAKARTADLQVELGRALLPTATAGVGIFSALTGKLGEYIKGLNDVKEAENAQKEGNATREQTLTLLNKRLEALQKERATQVEALKAYGDGENKYGKLIQANIDLKDRSIAGAKRKIQTIDEEIDAEVKATQAIKDADQAEIDRLNASLEAANILAEEKRLLGEEEVISEAEKREAIREGEYALANEVYEIGLKQASDKEVFRLEEIEGRREAAQFLQDSATNIAALVSSFDTAEINGINETLAAEINALEGREEGTDEYLAAKATLEKEAANKIFDIELKQFKLKKALSLTQIAIDTAIGVAKAWGQTGIFGLGAQVPVLAMGVTQAAVVNSEPAPSRPQFAQGGVATAATSAIVGEAGGEVMLGMGAQGAPLIDELAERIASKSGGGVNNYYFSSMVATGDPASMRKFSRVIRPFTVAEEQRIGARD